MGVPTVAQQDQQCLGSARMRVQCLAQWVKDPAMLQLQLGSDPWPGNSICPGAAKNEKKKKVHYVILFIRQVWEILG